jgi:hypothetical protein
MGRRSEQRIAISFPVTVSGSDSRGSPFVINSETHDISLCGASLKGLNNLLEPGMKIEIEFRDQRGWYRVQWVGKSGTAKAERAGVRCLEHHKYIWGVPPKETERDSYDPSRPLASPNPPAPASNALASRVGKERRNFARRACRIEALVFVEDDSVEMPGKITDISLGGCYVEMLQPLPVDTQIRLSLNPGESTLHFLGKVRSSQMGFGMGVSFTGMGPEDFERLRQFAPPTESAPAAVKKPALPTSRPCGNSSPPEDAPYVNARSYAAMDNDSLDLPPPAESLEAIIDLLLRKEIFTRAELMEELEKLKIVKTQ